MKSQTLKLLLLMFVSASAHKVSANTPIDLPAVGNHVRLFAFEKNENPQNAMIVFTRVDKSCHFTREHGSPVTGFYWLMDHRTYKPVHPMIRASIAKRVIVENSPSTASDGAVDTFNIKISELKEIDPSLQSLLLQVTANLRGRECDVTTDLMTGHPAKKSLRIESVYSESKKVLLPPFRRLLLLAVRGQNELTGENEEKIVASAKGRK